MGCKIVKRGSWKVNRVNGLFNGLMNVDGKKMNFTNGSLFGHQQLRHFGRSNKIICTIGGSRKNSGIHY